MKFLDPDKPIATCISETCDDCTVGNALHCFFTRKDLIHFLLIVIPSFLLGGAGFYNVSGWWLLPWLSFIIGFFGFVEIRVMCSHCPHYTEEGNTLKCWANYGSPKIWTYRPGPMTFVEKVIFFGSFAIVWGYPLIFLITYIQQFLLVVYILSVAGFFMTLKTFFCSQCINFACPLNSVAKEIRRRFFELNPDISKAWTLNTKQQVAEYLTVRQP